MNKRNFIKTAAYVAPVILTLPAMPTLACFGSNQIKNKENEHRFKYGKSKQGVQHRLGDNGFYRI